MKVLYYISTIPETFKQQALKNAVKQNESIEDLLSKEVSSLPEAINTLFDPSKSDEGEEYWQHVGNLRFPIFAR